MLHHTVLVEFPALGARGSIKIGLDGDETLSAFSENELASVSFTFSYQLLTIARVNGHSSRFIDSPSEFKN